MTSTIFRGNLIPPATRLTSASFRSPRSALSIPSIPLRTTFHTRRSQTTMSKQNPPVTPKLAPFFELLTNRHSVYTLDNSSPLPDDTLKTIITATLQATPSFFNAQTTRVLVLLRSDNEKFWDIVLDETKADWVAKSGQESWDKHEQKVKSSFRSAFGSIVMFEEMETVRQFEAKTPLYGHVFEDWALHGSGMNTLVLWTALEAEGYGANLQHVNYSSKLEKKAKEAFGVPESWKMQSQLVFGGNTGEKPGMKEKKSPDETIMWFGGQ